ncbi:PTS system alpha-glucoside-specific transporter subunit IICB [Lacticaseibacillus paracasei]|uniref:PTS system alpha-glucoside-specific transporter subunit IICB n=1 Tax=Lacticaseibacillus paracasei TaxID=1597 RepID=A0ABD6VY24_LACPA|nr:alpha-glucoside-specific PTS transporter subunit IIBC [Lacticaseibacillus paracasei]POE40599.1 PTS system alpha-glucoside-specific transporter subunit IICB [Lacticaseibacillus paracasei]
MMKKFQRFGAAMFTPVLLFSFAGIMTAICILMTNQQIFGALAGPTTNWTGFWKTLQAGAFTPFSIVPLLFVVGLPIGLAKKSGGRAAMESVVNYAAFNYMINSILTYWGSAFGFKNFANIPILPNATNQGLTNLIGIKSLDTSIVGALVVAGITVWLHNKYFDKKLPDWLGTFQGSSFVVILGFFAMIPLALVTAWLWPKVQLGIDGLQGFMKTSGVAGVWVYCFLERVLIPTGLHHFIYIPFMYGPAAVAGGLQPWWFAHLNQIAASTRPLKELAPQMGFAMYGNEKVFGILGICLAFYATAKKSKKKQTAALLIPAGLTALMAGITEPVEFTFLFAAPPLWLLHSLLAATMDSLMYAFGVVGEFSLGLIGWASENWIPLWQNHWTTYIIQIVIGLIFVAIYFFSFRFLILKFNYLTPGREADDEDAKLINKKEYKAAKAEEKGSAKVDADPYVVRAQGYLKALGGADNIEEITSCATRLRVTVKDEKAVASDSAFKANKAVGVVRHGQALQVIVGLDVPQVLESIQSMMDGTEATTSQAPVQKLDDTDPMCQKAAMISDSLGMKDNIDSVDYKDGQILVQVKDPDLVDSEDVFKSLQVGVTSEAVNGHLVAITMPDAKEVSEKL